MQVLYWQTAYVGCHGAKVVVVVDMRGVFCGHVAAREAGGQS